MQKANFLGAMEPWCVCDNKTKEINIRMLVGYWGWILLLGTCKLTSYLSLPKSSSTRTPEGG